MWALNNEGKLFVRKEVTSVFPEGTHWQAVTDNLTGKLNIPYVSNSYKIYITNIVKVETPTLAQRFDCTCDSSHQVDLWPCPLEVNLRSNCSSIILQLLSLLTDRMYWILFWFRHLHHFWSHSRSIYGFIQWHLPHYNSSHHFDYIFWLIG